MCLKEKHLNVSLGGQIHLEDEWETCVFPEDKTKAFL